MSAPVHRTPERPSAVALTSARERREGSRTGSPSRNPAEHVLLGLQAKAGNRAATAAVQRARGQGTGKAADKAADRAPDKGKAPENGGGSAGAKTKSKKNYRDRISGLLDRLKKNLDTIDTWVKGVQTPGNAGMTQQASASGDAVLKDSAAVSGTSAAGMNLATELPGTAVNALDWHKSRQAAQANPTGVKHHTNARRADVKGADTVVGAASSGNYAAAIAKEATKVQHAADAAMAAEASGVTSTAVGMAKGIRSGFRIGGAIGKLKKVKAMGDPEVVHAESLAELDRQRIEANWAAARAYVSLDSYWREDNPDGLTGVSDALDGAAEAMSGAREAAQTYDQAGKNVQRLGSAQKFVKQKQINKIAKESAGGALSEPLKAGAGAVTLANAVMAGSVLASNPVGWGLAGAGGGLILGVTLYKALRAVTKRYEEAHHPERWALEGETPEARSRSESLGHALKFWQKVSKGERRFVAHEIYSLAAGPDIPGSGKNTEEMRQSGMSLLIALKAGPKQHKVDDAKWVESLNDPKQKDAWIKEITELLASG
ncbi:hypothetical protein ACFUIW_05855 [Streptomyces sp. NPDC057245]|uniref:hypothetical protein n=1 Tax=Streptomyces sp. NPDC057245 TaxID=3346065 RepID=UPI00362BDB7C